jgi:hypothetical protein
MGISHTLCYITSEMFVKFYTQAMMQNSEVISEQLNVYRIFTYFSEK